MHDAGVSQSLTTSAVLQAWVSLRNRFVTKQNAAVLAQRFLRHASAQQILLFGSLAREQNPRDIDLLVLDDGKLSAHWLSYREARSTSVLQTFGIGTREARAAEQCGWLSTVFVNQRRFGSHAAYTLHVMTSQPDPLFFLNLADGLLRYDEDSNSWASDVPEVFAQLARLRAKLQAANVVKKQMRVIPPQ